VSIPARFLLLAQVGFFASLALCGLIAPEGFGSNHGWSYYESKDETVVPYLLGVVGCIVLFVYAAVLLERGDAPPGLSRGLKWLALFLFLDIATPDTVNVVFYWAHDLTSALLFLYQLLFALWIVRSVWTAMVGRVLLCVQFLGGLVAMFSQLQLVSLLGFGILVFQLSFAILLVAATASLENPVLRGSTIVRETSATAIN
jgi:hypothetical protein